MRRADIPRFCGGMLLLAVAEWVHGMFATQLLASWSTPPASITHRLQVALAIFRSAGLRRKDECCAPYTLCHLQQTSAHHVAYNAQWGSSERYSQVVEAQGTPFCTKIERHKEIEKRDAAPVPLHAYANLFCPAVYIKVDPFFKQAASIHRRETSCRCLEHALNKG